MICENCVKELERIIIARTKTAVNCLAYGCKNMKLESDGYFHSQCKEDFDSVLDTINKWSRPERLSPEASKEDAIV